ncbi:MAG: HAD-superfamily hydrolase, subfamily variant 3 [Acidobacteria bacterium]|nr:HAD-superfamily hydrolase, subfamily variant 3 [Acidobacteriota bacterium]
MSVEAVIFDMDGVLLDSEPVHYDATCALLAERGIAYTPAAGEEFFGCTDRDVFRVLKARYGLPEDEDALIAGWIGHVLPRLATGVRPLPGVPEVVFELRSRGLRLALASASTRRVIAASLEALGLSDAFETRVTGDDVKQGKPSPEIFLEATRRLALPPSACLVVEDSYNGLQAARAAGIPCAVVPCPSTAHQDFTDADARLSSLHELVAWVETMRNGK